MSASLLRSQLSHLLTPIYPIDVLNDKGFSDVQQLVEALITAMQLSLEQQHYCPQPHQNHWDESRSVLITYADTLLQEGEAPLRTLSHFIDHYCEGTLSDVHLLPFYPYSSDDGFSVIDYSTVNPAHGDWEDIRSLARKKGLMFDLVINHCSARSQWFDNFVKCEGKGWDFFKTAMLDDDLSNVTRPRTSPLLRTVLTERGEKHVWCTFSHDQVDFDFANPHVLIEFAHIIAEYLQHGATLFRLDAVAFLWKSLGTTCINLHFTHDIIKVYRLLIERAKPNAIIITETNIPNHENLQYFGNANEAHAIYNFALPPLILHTMLEANCDAIRTWSMAMPPAQNGTTYFNFIASHDGIGLRPVEGLLSDAQIANMVNTCTTFDGRIGWRARAGQEPSAYEINIALFDACRGTVAGLDQYQIDRFICMHAIMLGLEGIPGIYIHSLFGTPNDLAKMEHTGQNRSINRHRWQYSELQALLDDCESHYHQIFTRLSQLIRLRAAQPAFHPNATQFTLQLGSHCFGFWRQSLDRKQSIFCISNVTGQAQVMRIADINLIATSQWHDLISSEMLQQGQHELYLAPYQTIWLTNQTSI